MKHKRYIYFIAGFPLFIFSGFLLLISILTALNPRGLSNPWILVVIFGVLFGISISLLRKWYKLGLQELSDSTLVKNDTVILDATVTWRSGQNVNESQSVVVLDAIKQIVLITPENQQSITIPFAELTKIRIKQFGTSTGRIFALDTTNGRYVFFLANSVKQKNDLELNAFIATIGSAGITTASLLLTALIHKDPSLVIMPETLDKLHFWFKQHMLPSKYSARFTRSMNGVIFMTLFLPVMIILGIILERIGRQIGLSDPAVIPGILFFSSLLLGVFYVYVIYPRRFAV